MNNIDCHGQTNLELLSNPSEYSALKGDIKKATGIPSMLVGHAASANPTIETAIRAFNASIIVTNSDMKTMLSTMGTLSKSLFYWLDL